MTVIVMAVLTVPTQVELHAQFSTGLLLGVEHSRLRSEIVFIRKDSSFDKQNASAWSTNIFNVGLVETFAISEDISMDIELGYSKRQEFEQSSYLSIVPYLKRMPNGDDSVALTELYMRTTHDFAQYRIALKSSCRVVDELRVCAGFGYTQYKSIEYRHQYYVADQSSPPGEKQIFGDESYDEHSVVVLMGMSYSLNLNERFQLEPFVRYERGLEEIVPGGTSKMETLRAGFAFRFIH